MKPQKQTHPPWEHQHWISGKSSIIAKPAPTAITWMLSTPLPLHAGQQPAMHPLICSQQTRNKKHLKHLLSYKCIVISVLIIS